MAFSLPSPVDYEGNGSAMTTTTKACHTAAAAAAAAAAAEGKQREGVQLL